MALAAISFNLRVEKRPEASFSHTIKDIHSWLDQHQVRPVSVTPVATRENGVGFEVSFNTEDEVNSFQREFAAQKESRPTTLPRARTLT